MSQAGYTPIQLYFSTTAAAVPVNTNLANGELAINITDGKLYYKDNGGTVRLLASNATSAPVLSFSAGTTGLTPNTATSGAITLAGTLATTNGGTGLTAFTANQVFYASSTSAFAQSANLTFNGTTLTANTIGAFTLGGTIAGGGNQINNVIIGTTTPLAGAFTTLSSTLAITAGTDVKVANGGYIYSPTGAASGTVKAGIQFDGGGNIYSKISDTTVTNVSSTGLAVTGALSATGDVTLSGANPSITSSASNAVFSIAQSNGTSGRLELQGAESVRFITYGSSWTERFRIASTGAFGLSGANYGTSGQVLTSGGSGAAPTWTTVGGGGGGSPATPTVEGLVYGKMVSSATATTALGYNALVNNTGARNTAVGWNAAPATGAGADLTAIGKEALASNTSGSYNVAVGGNEAGTFSPLTTNTTGGYNVAIGNGALAKTTTANFQTAIGYQALFTANHTANTNGYSTAIGYQAGKLTTSGTVTAIGANVLISNTTGTDNVGVGGETDGANCALKSNTTGSCNTAVGVYALQAITVESGCSAFGFAALGGTTAPSNSAFGFRAAQNNTTGSNNVALGYQALYSQTSSGSDNTAVGYNAGYGNTGGYQSIFIGSEAGYLSTAGNFNTYIGTRARGATTTTSDCLVVSAGYSGGNFGLGKGDSTAFINGNLGSTFNGANSSSWATTSDRRLKKNIVDNNIGLDAITSIRVRNFEYRLPDEVDAELNPNDAINKSGVQLGVIAQELQAVLSDCVKQESTGVLSVDTDNLTWYMINAIKELKAEVDSLKSQLNQGA